MFNSGGKWKFAAGVAELAGAAGDGADGAGFAAAGAGHAERSTGGAAAGVGQHPPRDRHRPQHVMHRDPPAALPLRLPNDSPSQ